MMCIERNRVLAGWEEECLMQCSNSLAKAKAILRQARALSAGRGSSSPFPGSLQGADWKYNRGTQGLSPHQVTVQTNSESCEVYQKAIAAWQPPRLLPGGPGGFSRDKERRKDAIP